MNMKAITVGLSVLAFGVGLATWLLPVRNHMTPPLDTELAMHVTLVITVTYTLMHIQTAGLFVAGLRNFKAELRRSYGILCAGIIAVALAQLQTPVAVLADMLWWFTSGFVLVLFLLSNTLMYAGIRSFAQLVQVRSRWASWRFAMPVLLLPPILSFFAPVSISSIAPTPEAAHMYLALPLWQASMNATCAYLAWRIKRTMGGAYTDAMHWLFLTMAAYTFMSIHFTILPYVGFNNWYGASGVYLWGFLLLSTMFVIASYKFWKIGAPVSTKTNASPLDVVIYAASLATNPRKVDPIMDRVRMITAKMSSEQVLTADEEKVLGDVYLKLEEYLVQREPLRKLSRDELRQHIDQQFPHADQNSPFWQVIAAR